MKNKLSKTLQAVTLSCAFSSVSAQENPFFLQLDTTNPIHTKHYQLGTYKVTDDSVSMKMYMKRAFDIALELKDSNYTYVAFSSKKLGESDKKNCVFIPFDDEVLDIKTGIVRATITVEKINLSLRQQVEDRNCIALTKQKLGEAIKAALF